MTVVFYLFRDMERHKLGEVRNGEVIEETQEGFTDLVMLEKKIPTAPDFDDEDELLRTYEGPVLVAVPADESPRLKE